jgi:curved DNA-binding protein CbpA
MSDWSQDGLPELDLYAVLGVAPHAASDEIRAAYRSLARTLHPDLGGEAARMATLNGAWTILRDPIRRAEYDTRHGYNKQTRSAGPRARRTYEVARDGSTILDFGRYAGSSIGGLARSDPDYLEWLARTQIGRPLRREIEQALRDHEARVAAGKRPRRFGRIGPRP